MVSDISWAYNNYFGRQAAVAHYNIDFYQHLSFTILDDDDMIIKEDIKLRVSDVVEMELFEWFDLINFDSIMQCNRYILQGSRDNWKRIHPISIVNSHRKVHFVHDCSTSCTIEKHDINNKNYFKNDFLFTAA